MFIDLFKTDTRSRYAFELRNEKLTKGSKNIRTTRTDILLTSSRKREKRHEQ